MNRHHTTLIDRLMQEIAIYLAFMDEAHGQAS